MRIAIVTGASRGLGLALTTRLVADGWAVVGDARDAGALFDAFADLGDEAVALPGDVSDPEHRRRLVDEALSLGGLDLLVNNASLLGPSPQPRLAEYPLDVLRRVYEVNVVAPVALTQLCLPLLTERGGAVVTITSDAAMEAYEGWGGYGSSKAALEQLSNVLAAEHPDLSVYWVDPGDMNTRMHQEAFPGEDISDRPDPAQSVPGLVRIIVDRPPSGRYHARRREASV
jgi:NAD(P)-dependent dehydrogenase (short-subunit alcohol dehydrogenase family)